jgi:predicted AlkP superfamily pyrophosphatase or phosphodiesterase
VNNLILDGILKLIEKEKKEGDFIYPFYEKYCFSKIPSTILNFFGVKTENKSSISKMNKTIEFEKTNKLILLIVDGFGFNQWSNYYMQHEFFAKISKRGTVFPITSVFPSTTANAITCINSGLTPQEHALPEWVIYFKEIDQIINTVHFKPLGSKQNDELLELGINPTILFDGKTIHQKLKEEKVDTFTFIDESIAQSVYSKLVFEGSTIRPAVNNSDLIIKLRKQLERTKGPGYFYLYLGNLDSIAHKYGPHTEEYKTELTSLSFLLEKELVEKIDAKTAKESLLFVTADHGQLNTDPQKTVYLNRYKKLVQNFQKSPNNKAILPTGSPRDVFLHIKPDKIQETREFLSSELKEKAEVIESEEAINRGLFGMGKPKTEFLDRIGNLLILPHGNHTIWYKHPKGREFDLLGFHGGLNSDEMLVPFAKAKLSALKTC